MISFTIILKTHKAEVIPLKKRKELGLTIFF